MKPGHLNSYKEFLAAEWGVQVEDITDEEAVRRYRRRHVGVLIGASIVLLLYVLIRVLGRRTIADGLFLLTVLAVGVLAALRLRYPRRVSPGRLKGAKEAWAGTLGLRVEEISDQEAVYYYRAGWKSLLIRFSFLCLAYVLYSMLLRSVVADVLVLVVVLSIGVLSVLGLVPNTQK